MLEEPPLLAVPESLVEPLVPEELELVPEPLVPEPELLLELPLAELPLDEPLPWLDELLEPDVLPPLDDVPPLPELLWPELELVLLGVSALVEEPESVDCEELPCELPFVDVELELEEPLPWFDSPEVPWGAVPSLGPEPDPAPVVCADIVACV